MADGDWDENSSSGGSVPVHDALGALRLRLSLDGIDLVHPMSTSWYNRSMSELAQEEAPTSPVASLRPLPDYGRSDDPHGCLALILGNSASIWRPFLHWLRADYPKRLEMADPLDAYVAEAVDRALLGAWMEGESNVPPRKEVFWAWETDPDRLVAIARAAHWAGLAHLDETSHLSIHPTYGAWFSLRAMVVIDQPGPAVEPPDPPPTGLSEEERDEVERAFERALAASSADLSELLVGGGGDAGEDDADGDGADDDGSGKEEAWRKWVALRDVVERGREHRFGEDQIEYHYTKSKATLRRSLLQD